MKVEKTGRFIVGVLVVLVTCSPVWAGWSAPVLLSELNVPGGDEAVCSRLSSDGLTMYFVREIPAYGDLCIVEAYRSTPVGPFTSERILSELRVSGGNVSTPWISGDELRLYYHEPVSGVNTIKMAQRSATTESWTPVETFDELHTGGYHGTFPSLSGDELTIIWTSATKPGSAGGVDMWMATRTSTDTPFGNIRPLWELNTSQTDSGPCLLPDGLTLYFGSTDRDGDSGNNIYRATRSFTYEAFGNVQLVQLPDTQSVEEAYVFVTSDEETLFYSVIGQGIWMSQWVETTGVFHVDAVNGDNSNDGLTKDSAFATIQFAIDLSAGGSTVLVWPGSYNEQVDFLGKAITVQSAAEAAQVYTSTGYAFSFHTGEGADSVLKNIVIRDSEYGIYLTNDSSPTISNLTIVNNDYGISAFDGSNPNISNCILWANTSGDLFDCQATYSCIADGAQGEGNIVAYPLFADGGYHLQSERGRVIPVDPTLPPWAAPVHVAELDDAQGNNAASPCLSSDGLSMYFYRYIPGLGHNCIVEATRSFPSGQFTSERVLTELAVGGSNVQGPWISQDGLRLYYNEFLSGANRIRMAQRSTITDQWTPAVKTFQELHEDDHSAIQPALTADELEIFFQSFRPGGGGNWDIWTATRTSIDEPFGNIRPLYELNTSEVDGGPHIMPDGLTLYFNSTGDNTYRATRDSRNGTFGDVQLIEYPDHAQRPEWNPYVTADEKTIYIQRSSYGIYVLELIEGQWVLDDVTSPCVDAGNAAINPAGERMPNGGRLNMGAYGGTDSASMSEWPIEGDINRDGIANIGDLAVLSRDWLSSLPWFGE